MKEGKVDQQGELRVLPQRLLLVTTIRLRDPQLVALEVQQSRSWIEV